MATTLKTEDGDLVDGAVYVRHLRTLTDNFGRGSNVDIDEYRLPDGRVVEATSGGNARHCPVILDERTLPDYS